MGWFISEQRKISHNKKPCSTVFCMGFGAVKIEKQWFCVEHALGHPDASEKDKEKAIAFQEKVKRKDERIAKAAARKEAEYAKKASALVARRKYLAERAKVEVILGGKAIARANAVAELCVPSMKKFAQFKSKNSWQSVHVFVDYHNTMTEMKRSEKHEFFKGSELGLEFLK